MHAEILEDLEKAQERCEMLSRSCSNKQMQLKRNVQLYRNIKERIESVRDELDRELDELAEKNVIFELSRDEVDVENSGLSDRALGSTDSTLNSKSNNAMFLKAKKDFMEILKSFPNSCAMKFKNKNGGKVEEIETLMNEERFYLKDIKNEKIELRGKSECIQKQLRETNNQISYLKRVLTETRVDLNIQVEAQEKLLAQIREVSKSEDDSESLEILECEIRMTEKENKKLIEDIEDLKRSIKV